MASRDVVSVRMVAPPSAATLASARTESAVVERAGTTGALASSRNSFTPCPRDFAISGSLPAPKMIMMITKIMTSSCQPRPAMYSLPTRGSQRVPSATRVGNDQVYTVSISQIATQWSRVDFDSHPDRCPLVHPGRDVHREVDAAM